jgi:hypothetical protein
MEADTGAMRCTSAAVASRQTAPLARDAAAAAHPRRP